MCTLAKNPNMNTPLQTKKEFALSQIAPYYKDRSLCAYNREISNCEYLTPDGKMCVLGKNLVDPSKEEYDEESATELLGKYGEEILKPEVRGILSVEEWQNLQQIHDCLAIPGRDVKLEQYINEIGLFTLKELQDYES